MIVLPAPVDALCRHLNAAGAQAIIVGGFVRDAILGLRSKDIDIEVYGLRTLDELKPLLEPFGRVAEVGRSFGVLKLKLQEWEIDCSFPRTENKTAPGHKGFTVSVDGDLPFQEAARRRDFTINAMGYDTQNATLLDPYGGAADLKARRLRCVDETSFTEDPLRVLRAMQFAARFELEADTALIRLCRRMVAEGMLCELPKERLYEEFRKLFLKASRPSLGLRLLDAMEAISHFPELEALKAVPQEPLYHPEGDVWIHTLLCIDAMAAQRCGDAKEDMILMFAVLCHDFGKPATTATIDGRIRAIGHEIAGLEPTRTFLSRLSDEQQLFETVLPLVEHHLKPVQFFSQGAKSAAIRRLSTRVNLQRLVAVARADFLGRTTPDALEGRFEAGEWLLCEAQRLNVLDCAPSPLLQGRDLIARGLQPGESFKTILHDGYEAQLEGLFDDTENAQRWLSAYLEDFGKS